MSNIPFTDQEHAENFWRHSGKRGDDECWEWELARDRKGYGRIKLHRVSWQAHRMAWKLTHGEIPAGLYVCHKCDNPPCVNPKHLFLGTHSDNLRDCVAKGRHISPLRGMTHCKRGHQFTEVNTRRSGDGYRRCRKCAAARSKKYYYAKRK